MALIDSDTRIERLGRICLSTCLLLIILSGCSEITPTLEPATITFAYWKPDMDRIEPLIQEFKEQYPQITVNLRPQTMGELAWDVGTEDADVHEVFVAIIGSHQERGDFLALDPFIERDASFDMSDFYPAALETFTIEGKTWAIPYGADTEVMFYNRDLFDQRGVPYPQIGWTWDDFVSTSLALRDPEAGIYGYANNGGMWSVCLFVHQRGGQIVDDRQNPTRATFDAPLTVEALDWYGDLFQKYTVAPTPEQLRQSEGGILAAVVTGKVGMWSDWFEARGGDSGEIWGGVAWPMRWGMVTFPQATGDRATGIIGDLWIHGYAISSQTQHPDAAWELIAFLSKQAPHRYMPVRRSYIESEEYEQQVGSETAAVARTVLENGLPYAPRRFIDITLETLGILEEAAAMVESGRRTAQEATAWAQQQAETRIEP